MLTLSRLREVLEYDHLTGHFTWAISTPCRRNGEKAGTKSGGYINITIDKRIYRAHRLAWFYMHGRWPKIEIDHINRNGTDNRIVNLREATRSQNVANSRPKHSSKSGLKGVRPRGERWLAQIRYDGRLIHIGVFDNAEAAHQAYREIADKLHGEYAF